MIDNAKIAVLTVLVAGALVGAGSAYVGMNQGGISPDEAGSTVADILENQSGTSPEVVNVAEESGMYEVQLNANDQLQTYYMSKDGQLLSAQMTEVSQVQETLKTQMNVQNCLEDKGAVLYGNATQQATTAQIQVLGGADNVANFYKDVNSPENLQEATERGVESVPAFWLDGDVLSDVNNLDQVSNFASCE